jgi:signal transduction histidine kinase
MSGTPPRTLLAIFLAVTLVPACGLIVLGWQLIRQDRDLAAQRLSEVREQTAQLAVASLIQTLAATSQQLAADRLTTSPGAILVSLSAGKITNIAGGALLFENQPPSQLEPSRDTFAAGEAAEFQTLNLAQAASSYRALTSHASPDIRASAWMRLGRVLRKSNEAQTALVAYQNASTITATFAGVPVELAARRAICALHSISHSTTLLHTCATALARDLYSGKWRLNRAQYETHAADISQWCQCPRPTAQEALTTAAHSLPNLPFTPASFGQLSSPPVTILWHRHDNHLRVFIASHDYVERHWISPIAARHGARLWFGDSAESQQATFRGASITGLPWPVAIAVVSPDSLLHSIDSRQRLLLSALALILVLAAAGSYIVVRSVSRELAVARLQSDFVAAVSHEFRTPLTALSQAAESLTGNRVPEDRRPVYYETLSRATARLQRLVEQLLDFGRMEAGATPYRLQTVDAAALATAVAIEFRQQIEPLGFTLQYIAPNHCHILADSAALSTALWNLLDNAAKYSGDSRLVELEVLPQNKYVLLQVRDHGFGIDPSEHQAIFQKFVRGERSKSAGIKGTGIGLAMVSHIVAAHHGRVSLTSTPGNGATFTIHIPTSPERINRA